MPLFNSPHPGRILRIEMGDTITVTALAEHIGVTRSLLSMILNGRAGISPLLSVKLDEAFEKSPGFWLRLQRADDLAQVAMLKRKRIPALQKAA
jgi:addiction module HigA family antidote